MLPFLLPSKVKSSLLPSIGSNQAVLNVEPKHDMSISTGVPEGMYTSSPELSLARNAMVWFSLLNKVERIIDESGTRFGHAEREVTS